MKNELEPNTSQKFVIVETRKGEYVLAADPDVRWHKDIVKKMSDESIEITEVLGGGWIRIDTESETVYVWGKSSNYGEVSFSLCKQLLNELYDYAILKEPPSEEKL